VKLNHAEAGTSRIGGRRSVRRCSASPTPTRARFDHRLKRCNRERGLKRVLSRIGRTTYFVVRVALVLIGRKWSVGVEPGKLELFEIANDLLQARCPVHHRLQQIIRGTVVSRSEIPPPNRVSPKGRFSRSSNGQEGDGAIPERLRPGPRNRAEMLQTFRPVFRAFQQGPWYDPEPSVGWPTDRASSIHLPRVLMRVQENPHVEIQGMCFPPEDCHDATARP